MVSVIKEKEPESGRTLSSYNPLYQHSCAYCINRDDCKYSGYCNQYNQFRYFEEDKNAVVSNTEESDKYEPDENNMPIDSQREWTLRYLKPTSKRVSLDFSCSNITSIQANEIIARLKVIELCNIGGFEITKRIHQAKIDGILNTSRSVDGFNSVIATQQITKQHITHDQNIKEIQEKTRGNLIAGNSFGGFKKKR